MLSMNAAALGLQFQDVVKTGSIKKVAFGQRSTNCRDSMESENTVQSLN